MVESAGERVLVDCGPDLRQQLLATEAGRLDGVIVTHAHGDHCHGIDELRPVAQAIGGPVPIHARADVLVELQLRFAYAFEQSDFYRPIIDARELGEDLRFGDTIARFVDQPHGGPVSLGIRFDEGSRSAAYAIDFSELTGDMAQLYEGVDVWIADCLTRLPHPTHAHLDGVLAWARDLRVGQLYLTHMGNGLDYRTLLGELPDWAAPAHDGLEIVL
jgi:phosphoribosyl 1,2-cyclic phosphate phosphodiesterase